MVEPNDPFFAAVLADMDAAWNARYEGHYCLFVFGNEHCLQCGRAWVCGVDGPHSYLAASTVCVDCGAVDGEA